MAHKKSKAVSFLGKYSYALFGSAFFLTLGLMRGKNRALLADVAEKYGWKNPEKSYPTLLPKIDAEKIAQGKGLQIHLPVSSDGNVSLLELVVLNSLIEQAKPGALFEIGTFDGRTTLNMAANTGEDAKVYTLDLPNTEREGARKNPLGDYKFIGKAETGYKFKKTPFTKKITQLEGDSATFDYGPYKKSIDFIFVDGAHSYEYVMSDTENSMKMLREGGIVLWHDYRPSCEGVTKALNELYAKGGIWKNLRSVKGTNLAVLLPEKMLKSIE